MNPGVCHEALPAVERCRDRLSPRVKLNLLRILVLCFFVVPNFPDPEDCQAQRIGRRIFLAPTVCNLADASFDSINCERVHRFGFRFKLSVPL